MRTADFGLVDVLAAGAARAHGVDAQVGVIDLDIDVLDLRAARRPSRPRCGCARKPRSRARAARDARRISNFRRAKTPAPGDLGDDFLEAALGSFARGENLGLPAVLRRVALVHAEEVAGEQRRLVAAGAGADFEDDVWSSIASLGMSASRISVRERRSRFSSSGGLLFGRDGAHFGVGRRVGDHVHRGRRARRRRAVGLHPLDDRGDLGELAGELDIGFGRRPAATARPRARRAAPGWRQAWLREAYCASESHR